MQADDTYNSFLQQVTSKVKSQSAFAAKFV